MKINLKLQNIILLIIFAATIITCLIYDFYSFAINPASAPSRIVYLTDFDAWKDVYICTAILATIAMFWVSVRYNKIRQQKTDKYLASLIFYSTIYQGAGYILHIVQILFTGINSLGGVAFKLYMPLDILALMFFSFMAMEVFMKPAIGQMREYRIEIFILVLQICGIFIGITIILFSYTPDGSPFEITMAAIGFSVFGLIVLVVCVVISKMLKMLRSISDPVQTRALKAIAIQLIFLLVVTFFMTIIEMSSFTKMAAEIAYIIRITQASLSIIIAWLYYPAFIHPSEKKDAKQE